MLHANRGAAPTKKCDGHKVGGSWSAETAIFVIPGRAGAELRGEGPGIDALTSATVEADRNEALLVKASMPVPTHGILGQRLRHGNCVHAKAVLSRMMALRVMRSFLATATMASFFDPDRAASAL